ncbi:MAG: nucleic acid-binding protein [Treponema bryantii]|nr:nucleic acid-binding protein [Treponema bryantii]MBR6582419.1 nucleic acid-binding protein [Treponema sp.]
MEVTEEIFTKLKDLQEVLVEKYQIEAKKSEAPKQLSSQEELLAVLKKEYIAKNNEYDSIKEKVLKIKFDLEQAVKSRESGEQGMDNITTHREYEALEKQVNEAKALESDLRKELQKEEKILTELKENLKISEDMISGQENELAEGKASLDKQINEYEEKLKELKEKEDSITPGLSDEILFKFERIIQRNTEGIVSVKDEVCNGCNMILPSQFVNLVREGNSINFCPYCSRILYYEESENDTAENHYFTEDIGSLVDLSDDLEDYDDDEKDYDLDDDEDLSNVEDQDEDAEDSDDSDDSDED